MKILLSILLICLISVHSFAREITLQIYHDECDIIFTFEESNISEKILKQYAEIHPVAFNAIYSVPYPIEQCVEGDEEYLPCGSGDINAENFFKNAEINLKKSEKDLNYLNNLPQIDELIPLVDYFKKSLTFGIWLNKTLYEYLQTWDINILKTSFNDINPVLIASMALKKIENAKTKEDKFKIATVEWSNALNKDFRRQEGKPPMDGWMIFLSKNKIEEKIDYWE